MTTASGQLLNIMKGALDHCEEECERLRALNAELTNAIEEYACTGSDKPCGCYALLSKEKTVIAELVAALGRLLDADGPFYQGPEDDEAREKARAIIAKAKGET